MAQIKLHDILWQTKNAGASPDDNRRTELYFAGCQKALSGHPCKNCFNPALWDNSKHIPHDVEEIVDMLDMHNIPKYITIVGGEPTDQLEGLKELIPLLKKRDYETIMFTWRDPVWVADQLGQDILADLAYVICGPYEEEHRIYDTAKDDGIHNAIGSDNQVIFYCTIDECGGQQVPFYTMIPVSEMSAVRYENNELRLIDKDGVVWNE